jgi:chitinase
LRATGDPQLLAKRRKPAPGRRACALAAAIALLGAAGCSSTKSNPAPAGRKYVSFTSYPGWIQASIPPGKFDYTPWTIISDFGLWPTMTGGIGVGDMGSLSKIPPAVAAAHKAGRTIIMAVGEEGQGPDFAAGASARYRPKLIASIVSYVSKYDFDGVDIDWEEDVPQNQEDYIALIRGLHSALSAAFPGRPMYLSTDVNVGQIPPRIAAAVSPYVDSINMETFHDDGVSSVTAYTRAGIPASKLLLGVGVTSGYYDSTEARVAAKVKYVEDHGLKGILFWQPGALSPYRTDPRLTPLRHMVGLNR